MIKNNKGFTLLELLISIFILTTVIFLGYRVINKSTIDVKNQSNINKGQLTLNNMNEYLTKDLERASSVLLSSSYLTQINTFTDDSEQENKITNANLKNSLVSYSGDKTFDYSYNINYKNDEDNIKNVTYKVEILKVKNNYVYSVSREENDGISISFITNEILKEKELPFTIEGNNPYEVSLGYNGKNDKFVRHEFTVTSRLYIADGGEGNNTGDGNTNTGTGDGNGDGNTNTGTGDNGNNTIPPDIPEEIIPDIPQIPEDIDKENSLCIGYWMLDESKYNPKEDEGDLYAWIDSKGAYGKQGSNKNEFYIRGDNANGNSGKSNAYMRNPNESKNLIAVNNTTNKASNLHKIKIYVSSHTKLEQTKVNLTHATFEGIVDVETSKTLTSTNNSYTLEGNEKGKWYEVKFKLSSNEKANFVIDGILSMDKSNVKSGYAMIIYGNKANDNVGTDELNGDLILELTKLNETQNTGEYYWKREIKYNMLDKKPLSATQTNKHNGYNENFNILLKNDSNNSIEAHIGGQGNTTIYDNRIQNIVGMKIKLEGNIKITNFNFPNYQSTTLDDTKKVYEFKGLNKNQHNISGQIEISSNGSVGDKSRLIIDFIYNE